MNSLVLDPVLIERRAKPPGGVDKPRDMIGERVTPA